MEKEISFVCDGCAHYVYAREISSQEGLCLACEGLMRLPIDGGVDVSKDLEYYDKNSGAV